MTFPALASLAVAAILVPTVAVAAPAAVAAVPLDWLAIVGIVWFAVDKIIDLLPVKENTVVQFVRDMLNRVLGKSRP